MPRLKEPDFLKCVFILLMVVFHLTYLSAVFPYAKQVVYTFHMPGFLILSGFLMNVRKTVPDFLRMLWWMLVPYVVMESGYIVMAARLPINEHIERLTAGVFFEKLLVRPLGPYWYLQTMLLCGGIHFLSFRLLPKRLPLRLCLCVAACYVLSLSGALSMPCAMYFFAGATLRALNMGLKEVFRPLWLSALLLLPLVFDIQNLDKAVPGGVLIVYFVMSLVMRVYAALPSAVAEPLLYIGRNTMPIFLFSPVFTILCRQLLPLFSRVPGDELRAMLFLVVALPLCVYGSLAVAKALDVMQISRLMFGKRRLLAQ